MNTHAATTALSRITTIETFSGRVYSLTITRPILNLKEFAMPLRSAVRTTVFGAMVVFASCADAIESDFSHRDPGFFRAMGPRE